MPYGQVEEQMAVGTARFKRGLLKRHRQVKRGCVVYIGYNSESFLELAEPERALKRDDMLDPFWPSASLRRSRSFPTAKSAAPRGVS